MTLSNLLELADRYVDHTGLKLSSVSSYAERDGKWLPALKRGEIGCTVSRMDRATRWFSDHWPADLAWPRDIPRPPKSKEAA